MRRGFTLVELIVVTAVIVVLTGMAVTFVNPLDYIKRSRDARRQADLRVIQTGLEQYYGNNNDYPALVPTDGAAFSDVSGITYLNNTPKDPVETKSYFYYQGNCSSAVGCSTSSLGYFLCASLEKGTGACTVPKDGCVSGKPSVGGYNYCVVNPF